MAEPILSEISIWGCNFTPRDWASCQGQLMAIPENTALYALIGTFYGGDGRNTMGIPDLRGRAPVGIGSGPGLSTRYIGQWGGWEQAYLSNYHLPYHTHDASAQTTSTATLSNSPTCTANVKCNSGSSGTTEPSGKVWGSFGGRENLYADGAGGVDDKMHAGAVNVTVDIGTVNAAIDTTFDSVAIGNAGSGEYHENMPPFQVMPYCIALQGEFPSRN